MDKGQKALDLLKEIVASYEDEGCEGCGTINAKLHDKAVELLTTPEKPEPIVYGEVGWTANDVQTLCKLDDEKADEWLNNNEKHIRDRLIECGWEVMEDLLAGDGIKIERDEDEDDGEGEDAKE